MKQQLPNYPEHILSEEPAMPKSYLSEIKQIIETARQKSYNAVNYFMVEAYWLTGRRIVEEEQQGQNMAIM
jgi:hypothetical protein